MIIGDRDELAGALCNLAMNALEAANGPLELQLWVGALNDDWLQIRVMDNGPWIGEDILDRVFDPFSPRAPRARAGPGRRRDDGEQPRRRDFSEEQARGWG